MSSKPSAIRTQIQLISNDQQAINAAYQVADFALEERNKRDQNRILPRLCCTKLFLKASSVI